MTYIPGAQAHVNEYDENTIKSLAEHLNQYIIASFTNDTLKNLKFSGISKAPLLNTLDQLMAEKDFLEEIGILEGGDITELYATIKEGYPKFLEVLKTESIIHNDINPRNILMDHKTKNVVSLIDWDHVTYGNPLKDLSDSVGVFYDNLDFEKATKYKKLFYKSFTSEWFTTLESISIDYAFWYYYTVGKWQAILFYLDLLRKYDNKYGERDRFIMEMKNNYSKWRNVILSQAR